MGRQGRCKSAADCTESCQAGIAGTGNGQLDKPKGVAIDEQGNVWAINDVSGGNGEELKLEGGEVKFVRHFDEGAGFEQALSIGDGSVYTIGYTTEPIEQWPIPATESATMTAQFDVPSAMSLAGVSCAAANNCTAVGAYDERSQPYAVPIAHAALAEHWNGHEWAVQQIQAVPGTEDRTQRDLVRLRRRMRRCRRRGSHPGHHDAVCRDVARRYRVECANRA